jgi:PAS domain-containing protein
MYFLRQDRGSPHYKKAFMRSSETTIANADIASPKQTSWATVAAGCRGILGAIPVAAYTCDGSGRITYFNPIAVAVWGRAPKLRDAGERYCGSYKLYSADGVRISHEECWMALALLQGRAYHGYAIVIERQDGTRIIGKAHAHPLRNNHGQLVGALNLVADITGLSGAAAHHSKPHDAPHAYSATVAMIEIAVSLLTAIRWENPSFE